jgi:hypothetical protein
MKLVTHFIDPGEASAAKSRLCKAGIMAEVASVDPHIIRPSKSGAERIGLWIVFEDQFEDAVLLLENPGHVPKRITSLDVIDESESQTD